MGMTVHESVLQIGKPNPLVGVLTETDSSKRRSTALLLLNSGIMHRVGSCRLSVRIARSVATNTGLPCLRFDFSGIGDSPFRRANGRSFEQMALQEVVEVMDHLKKIRGINSFILYGLCSGARIASSTAAVDNRVSALVQADGVCYPTPRSRIGYYLSRVCSLNGWRARITRWLGLGNREGRGLVLTGTKNNFEVPEFSDDPGRDRVAEQLKTLMHKGVRLRCVFTGRNPEFFYSSQYRDCFSDVDFGSRLTVDYYPNASHIFSEPRYQQELVDGIVDWVREVTSTESELDTAAAPALASLNSSVTPR